MQHTKYQGEMPCDFRQNLFVFPLQAYVKHVTHGKGQFFGPRAILWKFEPHRHHCIVVLEQDTYPSLVPVQPRKTRPCLTERLLMGRKESNQTNKIKQNTLEDLGRTTLDNTIIKALGLVISDKMI